MPLMTYAEISEVFGVNANSARALVRRKRWHRTVGNDGAARIDVPEEALAARAAEREVAPPDDTPADTPAITPVGILQAQVEQLQAELREVRERAAADIAAERSRVDVLVDRLSAIAQQMIEVERERLVRQAETEKPRRWWRRG